MELILECDMVKIKEFVLECYKLPKTTSTKSIPTAKIHDNPISHRSEFTQYLLSFTSSNYEQALLCIYNNTSYMISKEFEIYYQATDHKSNMCLFEIEIDKESGTAMWITDCIRYNNHDISTFNYTIRMKVASMFKELPTRPYFYHHQHKELVEFCTTHNITKFKYLHIPLVHPVRTFDNPFVFTTLK